MCLLIAQRILSKQFESLHRVPRAQCLPSALLRGAMCLAHRVISVPTLGYFCVVVFLALPTAFVVGGGSSRHVFAARYCERGQCTVVSDVVTHTPSPLDMLLFGVSVPCNITGSCHTNI